MMGRTFIRAVSASNRDFIRGWLTENLLSGYVLGLSVREINMQRSWLRSRRMAQRRRFSCTSSLVLLIYFPYSVTRANAPSTTIATDETVRSGSHRMNIRAAPCLLKAQIISPSLFTYPRTHPSSPPTRPRNLLIYTRTHRRLHL